MIMDELLCTIKKYTNVVFKHDIEDKFFDDITYIIVRDNHGFDDVFFKKYEHKTVFINHFGDINSANNCKYFMNCKCKIAVSQKSRECFPQKIRKNVNVIYNGINSKKLLINNDNINIKNMYNIPSDKKIILMLCRIENNKRCYLLKTILEKIKHLNVFGVLFGSSNNKLEIEKCSGDTEYYKFINENIQNSADIINIADIVLNLSDEHDIASQLIAESLLLKKFVIATNVGYVNEIKNIVLKCNNIHDIEMLANEVVDNILCVLSLSLDEYDKHVNNAYNIVSHIFENENFGYLYHKLFFTLHKIK